LIKKPRTQLHEILERGDFAPKTREKYILVLDNWIAFAGTDPKRWTRKTAQAFYDAACDRTSVRSANVYIASLRYVSKWYATLENDDKLDFAIVQTRGDDGKSAARHALTQTQAEQLIVSIAPPGRALAPLAMRDLLIVVVGLETGMRRMSLASMQLDGLTNEAGYPATKVQLKGFGKKLQPVPLSDTALLAMKPWESWLAASHVRTGPTLRRLTKFMGKKSTEFEIGGPISERMINNIIEKRADDAGLKHMHPHILRHTFVTWREAAGVPTPQIASITWHSIESKLGKIGVYMDRTALGALARNTTPAWLADLVQRIVP